jgi:hypothetical protein
MIKLLFFIISVNYADITIIIVGMYHQIGGGSTIFQSAQAGIATPCTVTVSAKIRLVYNNNYY